MRNRELRLLPRLLWNIDHKIVHQVLPTRKVVRNLRNPRQFPLREEHEDLRFGLLDPKVGCYVGDQFGFGPHRGVADPGYYPLILVEDPQQVDEVRLANQAHDVMHAFF